METIEKRLGRPRKAKENIKSRRLEMRLTQAEYDMIETFARKLSMTKSNAILKAIRDTLDRL